MRREQAADVGVGAAVAVGDHRCRSGLEEPGGVVVGPLPGDGDRGFRPPRFGVAGRVAQPIEDDDRAGGQTEGRDGRLAVVLGIGITGPGGRVEPEPVLRREQRVVGVRARPAVAMTEVDDDRRACDGGLDPGPRRVGAVDPDDVRRVAKCLCIRDVRRRPILRRRPLRGPHDDHDLRVGGRGRCRRRRHGEAETGNQDQGEAGNVSAQVGVSAGAAGTETFPASPRSTRYPIAGWS